MPKVATVVEGWQAMARALGVPETVVRGPAEEIRRGIAGAELVVFEACGHASIYEKVEEFNRTSLEFLKRQAG